MSLLTNHSSRLRPLLSNTRNKVFWRRNCQTFFRVEKNKQQIKSFEVSKCYITSRAFDFYTCALLVRI